MGPIERAYKKMLLHRCDGDSWIKYFSAGDFPGLEASPAAFDSYGNTLRGYFYAYPGCREDTLLVFCHGIGGGHRSYMTEIAALCGAGYRVFAYDDTGCFESEGEDLRSLGFSLADLDSALSYLKREGIFDKYKNVCVLGHSRGGFAAGCIPLYHDDIRKVVVISGFLSVESFLSSQIAGMKLPFKGALLNALLSTEAKADPAHRGASIPEAMAKGACRYLVAHSEDDPVVPYEQNAALLQKRFPDAEYLIASDRKHNPNYTKDAAGYLNDVFGEFARLVKQKKLRTVQDKEAFFADTDWRRMTAQDPAFWEKVSAFLDA